MKLLKRKKKLLKKILLMKLLKRKRKSLKRIEEDSSEVADVAEEDSSELAKEEVAEVVN
jgi:hypothetical protein